MCTRRVHRRTIETRKRSGYVTAAGFAIIALSGAAVRRSRGDIDYPCDVAPIWPRAFARPHVNGFAVTRPRA